MIKNDKGVTLMTLVITIVVMVILISIVGYFSIDSVRNSHIANEKKEFSDVVQYVGTKKAKLLIDEFNVEEEYKESVVTAEAVYLIASGLPESETNKIIEVNASDYLTDNYKYLYITADKLNMADVSKDTVIIKDAKNNYIINFFTGTIIALYDNGERIEVSGTIKGLNDIMDKIN